MRISDWSSDVCSSDLYTDQKSWLRIENSTDVVLTGNSASTFLLKYDSYIANSGNITTGPLKGPGEEVLKNWLESHRELWDSYHDDLISAYRLVSTEGAARPVSYDYRSEAHTSELQSLMRLSYAVFFLKQKIIH